MRLFLGTLILTNLLLSVLYGIAELGDGDILEMMKYNALWTIFYSLLWCSIWLIVG